MKSKALCSVLLAFMAYGGAGQAKVAYFPAQKPADELVSFDSCAALEKHVDSLFANEPVYRKGYLAFGGQRSATAKNMMLRAEAADALVKQSPPSAEMESATSGPATVVGTNNQVDAVDEADFVKFNGRHIFQIHNGTLRILKAWPASEMNQIASISFSGQPQELLVNNGHAVVMASDGRNLTATVLDISQPANPRQLTEFQIPGFYRTARLVGDTLRIVNQANGSFQSYWRAEREADAEDWFEDKVTRKLNIEPTIQMVGSTRRTLDVVKDCREVLVPKRSAPHVLTRIISIDLKAKKYDETLAFVQPDTVYASEKAIYLAHSGYGITNDGSGQQTAIHKFSILQGESVRYQASGVVGGHLINQFAMDEHKGHLRVATNGTESRRSGWFNRQGGWQQVSRILVLAQKGKTLKTIGKSGDMGKGERLYSVRFNGDKGYVVTFRQVDPLYTLDLTNPHKPRVVGELKVPGFSTYIHMLDAHHLLTVGQDADENTGRVKGLKLSVFNVRDFARPKEVKSLVFKSGVASESSYEHKAFSFCREKGILAIPASHGSRRQALLLFKVTTEDIKPASELVMTDLAGARRSFFADNILYGIGATGVRAADLESPQNPLSTVLFDSALAESGW